MPVLKFDQQPRAYKDPLPARRIMEANTLRATRGVQIKLAELGDDTGLYGAAALVKEGLNT